MDYLSLAGILFSLALIIFGTWKQVSIIILGPVAAVIVALTGNVNVLTAYGTNYMKGFADFVMGFMPLFLTGAIFGKLMETSGLTTSVANWFMKVVGEKHVVATLFVTTLLLCTAGVSVFIVIFTVYPMAIALFRRVNLPKKILPAIILGAASCQSVLPGTPSTLNIISTSKFGQAPGAAPITGFLVFTVLTVITLVYYYACVAKMRKNNEVFEETEMDKKYFEFTAATEGLPNPILSLLPITVVIVLLNAFKWKPYVCILTGIVILLALFWKRYVKLNLVKLLSDGAEDSMNIITTAAIIAYGSVIVMVPGFQLVTTLLDKVSFGNPYIFAFVATNIFAAIAGSATAAVSIVITAFKDKLLLAGANPASLGRLLQISGMGMDSLPHNGAIVLTMNYCGVKQKDGFKYMFVTTCVWGTIVGIIPVITGMLGIL